LRPEIVETIFQLESQAEQVAQWRKRHGIRRVILADFGKNIYATYRACLVARLQVACVADNAPAFAGTRYRGIPILPDAEAMRCAAVDGIVLSNINPAQVDRRAAALESQFEGPILRLWKPRFLNAQGGVTCKAA